MLRIQMGQNINILLKNFKKMEKRNQLEEIKMMCIVMEKIIKNS